VSDRPLPNPVHSRQAAKRFRRRGRRLARQLLDEAYAQYLSGVPSLHNSDSANNVNNNNDLKISVPSPPPPPPLQLPSPPPNQIPSPSRSPTPPFEDPNFPHSALISRIFPDSPPPSIRSFFPPSYSPISSPPRPTLPANSTTSSVEFIDEVPIPPPRPKYYYYYDPHQPLDTLIFQFSQRTTPLPPSSYSIGPDDFNLSKIRSTISDQDPDTIIPVFLPISPFSYEVPVRFFYNLFPPLTATIHEIN